ncbi:unnamed protein product [Auanema sp. JU1783]|nr:unnamed protein product [Auanema sp. JU1783]
MASLNKFLIFLILSVYLSRIIVVVDGIQLSSVEYPDESNDDEDEDDDDDAAEELYNKTYSEYSTELERSIFSKYSTKIRPAKNQSAPTLVDIHWHIIHASVNQELQTLTLHGHLFMRWEDEFLGWDPDDFNGIRIIQARKWHVWHPKIRVANSISGLRAHQDISPVAHVLIQTHSKEKGAMIEMYPTFSINVGCYFDYADYPNDINNCTAIIYSHAKMTEVVLRVYESWPPTLMLGWGGQESKRIISDFEMVSFTNQLLYYINGTATKEAPVTERQKYGTLPILAGTLQLRRHTALYGIGILLPCLVSIAINICSFYLPSLHMAVYSIMSNYFIQITFLQEFITKLPLSVSRVPDTVVLYGVSMLFNLSSFFIHVVLIILTKKNGTDTQTGSQFLTYFPSLFKSKSIGKNCCLV